MKKTTLIALLMLVAGSAGAQQVYRCGSNYSQQPCAGGTSVQVEDTRTQAEANRANVETKRQAKAADAMEKARLQQEAKSAPANILPQGAPAASASEPGAEKKAEAKDKAKAKPKKPDHFTAVAPKKATDISDQKKSPKGKQSS